MQKLPIVLTAAVSIAAPSAWAQIPEAGAPASSTEASSHDLTVKLGEPLELRLIRRSETDIPAREFSLVAVTDGPLTIDAESFDADVTLERLGNDGKPCEPVDVGGIGWNARLVIDATTGTTIRLRTGFAESASGVIVVHAQAGAAPLPAGLALARATADFHLGCARAAAERGDAVHGALEFHIAGQTYFALKMYADCRSAYEAALPLAEQADHPLLRAIAQGFLGAVAMRFGDATVAREWLVPASEAAATLGKPELEAFCLSNLSDARLALGDLTGAVSDAEAALGLARTLNQPDKLASMLSQRALLADREGNAAAAREMFEEALQGAEPLDDKGCLAEILERQAQFHRRRGELSDAEHSLLRALDVAVLPATQASVKGELGNVRNEQGRWSEAIALFQDVLVAAQELGDLGLQATALENLGIVEGRAGDASSSDTHLQKALALREDLHSDEGVVRVLVMQASLRYQEDRLADSQALLEKAVALTTEGSSDEQSILVLHQLVLLESRSAEGLNAASEHASRMLELARRVGSPQREAEALTLQAWILHRQGRNDEAAGVVARAVEASRSAAPHAAAAALSTQIDIALARRELGVARAALAEARDLIASMRLTGMDIEGASLARSNWSYAQFSELEQDVVALALIGGDGSKPDAAARASLVSEGFMAAGRAQGRALLEGIAEQRAGRRDAQVIAWRRERERLLADRETALAGIAAIRRTGDTERAAKLAEQAGSLAKEADAVLDQLRQRAPGEAALDVPPDPDVAALRHDVLGDDGVLIQYAEGQQDLFAYVLTKGSLEWCDLGPRDAAVAAARGLLDEISDPRRLGTPAAVGKTGLTAWRTLLQPILEHTAGQRLIVVPTPALAGLPFDALVTEAKPAAKTFDDLTFLIDRYEVSYAPSPAVLGLLASLPARASSPRLLVLADPRVPGERGASGSVPRQRPESAPWVRLPGTRTEALAILDLLASGAEGLSHPTPPPTLPPTERGGHLDTEQADVWLGQDASAARLRDDARRYSILHIAAHGAIDAGDPRRSGLVLAATDDDDGFLSVPEVLELDLDADLVVLSACDTARGAVRRGEGVQSLARAFIYAGAREVIATLWQVDDTETEAAMRSLYGGMHEGDVGVTAALRRAKLELRHPAPGTVGFVGTGRGDLLPGSPPRMSAPAAAPSERRGHPYFWAPFVEIGWIPKPR